MRIATRTLLPTAACDKSNVKGTVVRSSGRSAEEFRSPSYPIRQFEALETGSTWPISLRRPHARGYGDHQSLWRFSTFRSFRPITPTEATTRSPEGRRWLGASMGAGSAVDSRTGPGLGSVKGSAVAVRGVGQCREHTDDRTRRFRQAIMRWAWLVESRTARERFSQNDGRNG